MQRATQPEVSALTIEHPELPGVVDEFDSRARPIPEPTKPADGPAGQSCVDEQVHDLPLAEEDVRDERRLDHSGIVHIRGGSAVRAGEAAALLWEREDGSQEWVILGR